MRESTTVGGEPARVLLADLRLDWRNPRLPPEMQSPDVSQLDLALYIEKRYNPLEVAKSIGRHGFFESEPLIAVREDEFLVVVEGNRRLTALLGLAVPAFREAYARQTRAWSRLDLVLPLPELYPVVLVGKRSSVTPLLGFRHISGIREWEPFAQARYIADLVDLEGYSLVEVSELVGRPHLEVRATYRDHEILRQAREVFGFDVDRAIEDFGVFNAAMAIRNLRVYISGPTPANVDEVNWPLPDESKEPLSRLLRYVFGDARGRGRVLGDSRQLKDLGRVLADPTGRAEGVLQKTGNLTDASEALVEPFEMALKRLNSAVNALKRVRDEGPQKLDLTCAASLTEISTLAEELAHRTTSRGSSE